MVYKLSGGLAKELLQESALSKPYLSMPSQTHAKGRCPGEVLNTTQTYAGTQVLNEQTRRNKLKVIPLRTQVALKDPQEKAL